MNEKIILFKLLVHWILCQMLSDIVVVCSSSDGSTNDFFKAGTFTCCKRVSGPCKNSCENLSLLTLATATAKETNNLRKFCPEMQVDFWSCMNKTLESIERGSNWIGRACCKQGVLPKCQQGCAISSSSTELRSYCRQSDEFTLFSCIEEQEHINECCSNAKTQDCLQICQRMLFNKEGDSLKDLDVNLQKSCRDNNMDVIDCVHAMVEVKEIENPEEYVHCCRYAETNECRLRCQSYLKFNNLTETETINALEKSCGVVNLSSEFWTCFLNGKNQAKNPQNVDEMSRIKQIGLDSAKLHCCEKAQTTQCRRGCFKSFSGNNPSLEDFQNDCIENAIETDLKRCLEEVDLPAEVGCDGLSFCSNFNNRPTELFRSCNPISDLAARNELEMWKQQSFLTISGFKFPIVNINQCFLDTWHAIACILQLKPTTKSLHLGQICYEDCFDILTRCMDWQRMENKDILPDKICAHLSPDTRSPCVSIKPYLEPSDSPHLGTELTIMSPCRGRQCNATSEVCEVNRNINKPSCIHGCPVGEASNFIVPLNSYVRIPFSMNKGCYKVCKCVNGKIEKCQPLPCVFPKGCQIGNRTIEHGSSITIECNICTCFAEEITCTKKQCRIPGISDRSFTSLPCNCPPHFVPVCARNGKTYPSACLAKCSGLHDIEYEFGSCESKNPCERHDCPQGTVCFPSRNVCLSNMHNPCPQYRCVPRSLDTCNEMEPVTDTTMAVHSSLCSLIRTNKSLAYYGVFEEHVCKSSETVCGINGVTYNSECEAMSDFSMVDYNGNCKAVGLIDTSTHCQNVNCPQTLPPHCLGVIPTGACCPVCGGVIRIIYSRKQIDRGIYALKNSDLEALTLRSLLKSLQRLVKVSSCYLSGFLTFENDIMVIVYSIHKNPTVTEVEVCQEEAVKIGNLISTKSHHFTSDLGLSSFIVANYVKPTISMSNVVLSSQLLIIFTVLLCAKIYSL